MKLSHTLGCLALAGAVFLTAPSAKATVTFNSSATIKAQATIQDKYDVSTGNGTFIYTTLKLTIVNKDILAAFEDWWDTTLPAGAALALDEDYNLVIVNKDGDILFDAVDLEGFLVLDYGDSWSVDGKSKNKDNGDYSDAFDYIYTFSISFLSSNEGRSASVDTDTDFAEVEGLDTYSEAYSYDASKNDYKYNATDKGSFQGTGVIEDTDATITGTFSAKYNFKDDNYE